MLFRSDRQEILRHRHPRARLEKRRHDQHAPRAGPPAALPVFALDFLKGFVAVTIIEMLKYDVHIGDNDLINLKIAAEIGRASCRERVCPYV